MLTDGLELATGRVHEQEVARGERFEFGRNWRQFLRVLDETRILRAEESLSKMLHQPSLSQRTFLDIGCGVAPNGWRWPIVDLSQRTFLDIGCGSGLFSLAARRLGARVHSFDFDAESVSCAAELRRRFFPGDPGWTICQASVLDRAYMRSLGTFDIVYSWGVLHHTGRMWEGVDAACQAVVAGGQLFIALYNDLGTRSRRWRVIKQTYNRIPTPLRPLFTAVAIAPQELKNVVRALAAGQPGSYLQSWTAYNKRGMNRWRDAVDWVGGYPYEVATPEAVFDFCRARGFELTAMRCGGVGLGCNEFVFDRKHH